MTSIPEFKTLKDMLKIVPLAMALALLMPNPSAYATDAPSPRGPQDQQTALTTPQGRRVEALMQSAFNAYQANKFGLAAKSFMSAAKSGDVLAKYNLASMRIREQTKLISMSQSLAWIRFSAEKGLSNAQFSYGTLLDLGEHVEQDLFASTRWFEKAARQGHEEAALALATACFIGRGHALDYQKAAFWYEKAATAGDVAAQYSIASMYLTGLGVPLDLETALVWFSAAARQGDVVAKEQARLLVARIAKERT